MDRIRLTNFLVFSNDSAQGLSHECYKDENLLWRCSPAIVFHIIRYKPYVLKKYKKDVKDIYKKARERAVLCRRVIIIPDLEREILGYLGFI